MGRKAGRHGIFFSALVFDVFIVLIYNAFVAMIPRGRAVAARQAHNLEDVSSNLTPATISYYKSSDSWIFLSVMIESGLLITF